MSEHINILPARAGETDDEQRLRETVNRLSGQMLAALDFALNMRTAPQVAQKARNLARNKMTEFGLAAMHSLALVEAGKVKAES